MAELRPCPSSYLGEFCTLAADHRPRLHRGNPLPGLKERRTWNDVPELNPVERAWLQQASEVGSISVHVEESYHLTFERLAELRLVKRARHRTATLRSYTITRAGRDVLAELTRRATQP